MRKKLTSRKFWVAIATAAYFGGMAIRERDTQLTAIIYGLCMVGVVVAWIIIEGFCDEADEIEVQNEELIEDKNEEEEAA